MSHQTAPHPPKGQQMSWWEILKSTFSEWLEDRASRLAAAVAYYAIFSIVPLLMIALSLTSLLYGKKAAADQIRPQLTQYIGEKSADFVQQLLSKAAFSPSLSFASIVSLLLLLYAATNLFIALQDALNTIFDVEPKPNRGLKGLVADRALSFLMVLLLGTFILASVIFSTALAAATAHLGGHSLLHTALVYTASALLNTILFAAIFALLFKILPDIKIAWKDTLLGALITSITFNLARFALAFYLSRSSTTTPFGAAGSLVVIMLFVNYSAQILFLGAEFTQVWARRHGHPIAPADNALSLDPDYTDATKGLASSTNASGATGSRRHFDTAGGVQRATSKGGRTVGGTRNEEGPTREQRGGYPALNGVQMRGNTRPTYPLHSQKTTQTTNGHPPPLYPPEHFHPPHQRRSPYIEFASAAALLAIPLTWLVMRRGK